MDIKGIKKLNNRQKLLLASTVSSILCLLFALGGVWTWAIVGISEAMGYAFGMTAFVFFIMALFGFMIVDSVDID